MVLHNSSLPSDSIRYSHTSETDVPSATASLRLSNIQRRHLRWLLSHPFQRVEDMALALSVSANTVYRHMNRFIENDLVECITPSLGIKATCRLYYLTHAGILVVAVQEHSDPYVLAHTWQVHEAGLLQLIPRLADAVRLQNMINGLISQAPSVLAHENGHKADIAWSWKRDYQQHFTLQEHVTTLRVDASLIIQRRSNAPLSQRGVNKSEFLNVLLILDPGWLGRIDDDIIMQKVVTLYSYRQSLSHDKALYFPPILIVVDTLHQRETWQQYVQQIEASMKTPPLSGAIVVHPSQDPISSAWDLPWFNLSQPGPCHLREIFTLQSRDTLLPDMIIQHSETDAHTFSGAVKQDNLVLGKFSTRARHFNPEHLNDDITEQEHVALVRLCLSQRHVDVLELLYAHPLLSTQELSVLLELQVESVTRYLYELRRYTCIEKTDTSLGVRWKVSLFGLRLLSASHQCSLQHLVEIQGDT